MEHSEYTEIIKEYVQSFTKDELVQNFTAISEYFDPIRKMVFVKMGLVYFDRGEFEKSETFLKEGLVQVDFVPCDNGSSYSMVLWDLVEYFEKKEKEKLLDELHLKLLKMILPLIEDSASNMEDDFEWHETHKKLSLIFKEALHERA